MRGFSSFLEWMPWNFFKHLKKKMNPLSISIISWNNLIVVFFQIILISQVHANSAVLGIFQHFSQKIDSGRGLTDEYTVKGSPTSHFLKGLNHWLNVGRSDLKVMENSSH